MPDSETKSRKKQKDSDSSFEDRCFSVKLHKQYHQFCHNVLSFVWTLLPLVVNETLIDGMGDCVSSGEPFLVAREGCIVSVAISGISSLLCTASDQANAAGFLSRCLDTVLSPLVDIISSYNGDILRLEGAKLTVFFKADSEARGFRNTCGSLSCSHGPVELACLRASACSIEIQKRFNASLVGGQKICLSIGVSAGAITVVVARGAPGSYNSNALEYFCTGKPLGQAQRAMRLASPGQTVLCPDTWGYVQSTVFEGAVISAAPAFRTLHAFDAAKHTYPMVRHATQRSCKTPAVPECTDALLEEAFQFLPPAVIRNTVAGVLGSANDLRCVTMAVACVRIANGVPEGNAVSAARLVFSLQCLIHAEEAFLTALHAQDGDLHLQICFGLPPLVHADDSLRACRGCLAICNAVQQAHGFGFACHAGVATGNMFIGLVGHESTRRRYLVLGSPLRIASRLCSEAKAHTTLIDANTANACKGLVELEARPVVVSEAFSEDEEKSPTRALAAPVFAVHLPSLQERLVLRAPPSMTTVRSTAPTTCSPPPTPPPPAKPPWLPPPQGCREQGLLCWAHLCAERPPPAPNLRGVGNYKLRDAANPTSRANTDILHWKTHLKIPLPWPARSIVCGGVSPLPKLKTWQSMVQAESAMDAALVQGGGVVTLSGPSACGKVELTEHLLCRAVSLRMQPVIGAMEMRPGEQCAAFADVLRGLLALLEPSGHIAREKDFQTLLAREVEALRERKSLEQLGILRPADEESSGLTNDRLNFHFHQVNSMQADDVEAGEPEGEDTDVAIGVALRLARRVLEHGDLVVCLRVSQGTTLLEVDCFAFWTLVHAFGRLATSNAEKHLGRKLLVICCCQPKHFEWKPPGLVHSKVNVGPLSDREILRYIYLCIGFPDPGADQPASTAENDAPKTPLVPMKVVNWIRQVASMPRHLEECLTQLHTDGFIGVEDGRCKILRDFERLQLSDWTRTHVVGSIISQLEFMGPDLQHIMLIASIMSGTFSPLDLAVTLRLQQDSRIPSLVASYNAAKRLKACDELVELDFLYRKERTEDDGCLPLWGIRSQLVREVVLENVERGRRVLLKRAIVMGRAMERIKCIRKSKKTIDTPGIIEGELGSRFTFEDLGEKRETQRTSFIFGTSPEQSLARVNDPEAFAGDGVRFTIRYSEGVLPSSCVVHHDDEDSSLESSLSKESSEDEDDVVSLESEGPHMRAARNFQESANTALARVHCDGKVQFVMHLYAFIVLSFLLFATDIWLVSDGPLGALYALKIIVCCCVAFGLIYHLLFEPSYVCSMLCLADLVIFISAVTEVTQVADALSNREAPHSQITRKQPGSLGNTIANWVKFGACVARLFWLSQNAALRSVVSRLWDPVRLGRLGLRLGAVSRGESRFLTNISTKLARAILVVFSSFMVISITVLNVTDDFTPPYEDHSMRIWVEVMALRLESGNPNKVVNTSVTSLISDARRFDSFYQAESFIYGPFRLCKLSKTGKCENLWSSDIAPNAIGSFVDPERAGFQLDVKSSSGKLRASFDFSQAAKQEALMRIVMIALAMLGMLAAAVTLEFSLTRLLVEPLSRLLLTVHEVSIKMQAAFPMLDFHQKQEDDFGDDEVTAFAKNVQKVTRFVTLADKANQEKDKGTEWYLGSRTSFHESHPITLLKEDPFGRESSRKMSKIRSGSPPLRIEDTLLEVHGLTYNDIATWNFNVIVMEEDKLTAVAGWLVANSSNFSACPSSGVVFAFTNAMRSEYLANPYHNWRHAVDVVHGVARIVNLTQAAQFVNDLSIYSLLVAAISHDVGHPGLNNVFLVQTQHKLALCYNDMSPLENMHCSTMFDIMASRPDVDVFQNMSIEQYKEARKVCIETILHTDNEKHFEMIKDLKMFCAQNSEKFNKQSGEFPSQMEIEALRSNTRLSLNVFLHAADVSNPCKPWSICRSWAELVLAEFFLQGDMEKQLGIPVQMLNDRDTLNRPKSQVTFIQLFIVPFNKELVGMFPPLWEYTFNLEANLKNWLTELGPENATPPAGPEVLAKSSEELREVAQRARRRQGLLRGTMKRSDSADLSPRDPPEHRRGSRQPKSMPTMSPPDSPTPNSASGAAFRREKTTALATPSGGSTLGSRMLHARTEPQPSFLLGTTSTGTANVSLPGAAAAGEESSAHPPSMPSPGAA
eukprot:TRINITY_DN17913_c0_g1_i1.p1 TRINITY_DN17913_c0_g1~~TRINITY_DN17913_c0_g1_i1.p1  ORF type:complete len:2164 (-),score=356.42 TRINITY_DN17913_c0_g1_i1:49-6540(-)